jgi:glucan phosphoethanolaminetransferase (alkaline phosphatase superfamily)
MRWARNFVSKHGPLLGLALIVLAHNAIAFLCISLLDHKFNFGRRCVILHLLMVNGGLAVIGLCLGLCLRSRRVREKLLPKIALSCIPAAAFSLLLSLYGANYITNARWGNNFNYQVVAQWQLSAEVAGRGVMSPRVYASYAVAIAIIFGLYFLLSRLIFRGLAEIFPAGRPKWSRLSLIATIALAVVFVMSVFLLARNVRSVGHLMDEPIIGFFRTETASATDLSRQQLYPQMRDRENSYRANYPRGQQFSRRSVIVIIVDSLRDDHMGVYGYSRPTTPFLSSLYASGKLKRVNMALATCPYTSCGVLSTMTSENERSIIVESFKLYDLLFDQGYQVNFILSGNHEWYGAKTYFGPNINYYFDGASSTRYTANDDRAILEGLEPVPAFSGKPAFFYFHLMSPHYVGFKQDRYRIYEPSKVEGTWEALVSDKYDPITKTNNYDNAVIQSDAIIKEIFDALQQKGFLENSIVVILGDHGEGLGERGPDYYSHTLTLYHEFLRIPLLIVDTPGAKYANLEFATQVDIAPTIVDRLGLKIPPSWQGHSLLNPEIKQYSFHETRRNKVPLYAVIKRTPSAIYKFIQAADQEDELYELVSDPHERRNLISTADPALLTDLRTRLAEFLSHY